MNFKVGDIMHVRHNSEPDFIVRITDVRNDRCRALHIGGPHIGLTSPNFHVRNNCTIIGFHNSLVPLKVMNKHAL